MAVLEEKRKLLGLQESDLLKRQHLLEEKENLMKRERDDLQLKVEKYCYDKFQFEAEAKRVQEISLKVQEESEVIYKFKANFEAQKEEIERARLQILADKNFLRAEKVRLEELKNELNIRQKTLAGLRNDYVKESSMMDPFSRDRMSFADPHQYKSQPFSPIREAEQPFSTKKSTIPKKPEFSARDYINQLNKEVLCSVFF
jgi:hypothetical protein